MAGPTAAQLVGVSSLDRLSAGAFFVSSQLVGFIIWLLCDDTCTLNSKEATMQAKQCTVYI